jgi:Uma2 family endonuclease
MSVTIASPPAAETEAVEQRFDVPRVSWDSYQAISDALVEQPGVRVIYCEGSLLLMGKSRRHEWLSDCLGHLVMGIAIRLGIACEPAGEATYRRRQEDAGLEGDRTFHLGANAERMRGGLNYDFSSDPPPDLAIEVEVSNPADLAMRAWGKMRVPEIWRFDNEQFACSFWKRRDDGAYEPISRSICLPILEPADVVALLQHAQTLGTVACLAELPAWVDRTIAKQKSGGA